MDQQESTESKLSRGGIVQESYSIRNLGTHQPIDVIYYHPKDERLHPSDQVVVTLCEKAEEPERPVFRIEGGLAEGFLQELVKGGINEDYARNLTHTLPDGNYSFYLGIIGPKVVALVLKRANYLHGNNSWEVRLAQYPFIAEKPVIV